MALSQQSDEHELVAALRQGDETAFAALLEQYHSALLRLAQGYVPDRAVAEEIVQETWLGFLRSLDRFREESSIKTFLFRILMHHALNRRTREGRSIPFSALAPADEAAPTVPRDRFLLSNHRWAGHWADPPRPWEPMPEDWVLGRELRACIEAALTTLPPAQRVVLTLRDMEGWSASDTCRVLGISATYQRVLLHRARVRVRQALARYLAQE